MIFSAISDGDCLAGDCNDLCSDHRDAECGDKFGDRVLMQGAGRGCSTANPQTQLSEEALALPDKLRNNRRKDEQQTAPISVEETVMKNWMRFALCAGLLAGCTSPEDRIFFDGQTYSTKLRKVERQLDQFFVTVRPVSNSLAGAREAGQYQAVVHCVNNFGSSDIIWIAGPDAPQEQLNIESDTLTLQGRCPYAN